jgi:hypothetical protein
MLWGLVFCDVRWKRVKLWRHAPMVLVIMATMTGNTGNDSVSLPIDRVLDDLATIHNSLLTQAASPDSCGLSLDLAQELMTAVDAVRHLLWVYIQDTTPAANPGYTSSSFQQLVSNALAVSSQYSDADSRY